jgi:hypothetical protein
MLSSPGPICSTIDSSRCGVTPPDDVFADGGMCDSSFPSEFLSMWRCHTTTFSTSAAPAPADCSTCDGDTPAVVGDTLGETLAPGSTPCSHTDGPLNCTMR